MIEAKEGLADYPLTFDGFEYPVMKTKGADGNKAPQSYASYDLLGGTLLAQTHELARPVKVSRLYKTLEEYGRLEEGWDGYTADAAMPDSIVNARLLIAALPERFELPVPMLACDGEISLYWETQTAYLEASFPGDGSFHYIFNTSHRRIASDDIPISIPNISKEFLGCLEAM